MPPLRSVFETLQRRGGETVLTGVEFIITWVVIAYIAHERRHMRMRPIINPSRDRNRGQGLRCHHAIARQMRPVRHPRESDARQPL
jgi:hypothetical protein